MNEVLLANTSEYIILLIPKIICFFIFIIIYLFNILLFFSSANKDQIRRLHHPYGTPGVVHSGANFCLLYHSDYINGYSKDRLMPLWVSYTMRPLVSVLSCCLSYVFVCGCRVFV